VTPVFEDRVFGFPGLVLGTIIFPLGLLVVWAGWSWGEPGFFKLGPAFSFIGLLVTVPKKTVRYDPKAKLLEISFKVGVVLFRKTYNRDDFKSITPWISDHGPDYGVDGRIIHLKQAELQLDAKKGGKDLQLYFVSYGARGGWFADRERKRFDRIVERTQAVLGLPFSRW
jgi:hypothetical protein